MYSQQQYNRPGQSTVYLQNWGGNPPLQPIRQQPYGGSPQGTSAPAGTASTNGNATGGPSAVSASGQYHLDQPAAQQQPAVQQQQHAQHSSHGAQQQGQQQDPYYYQRYRNMPQASASQNQNSNMVFFQGYNQSGSPSQPGGQSAASSQSQTFIDQQPVYQQQQQAQQQAQQQYPFRQHTGYVTNQDNFYQQQANAAAAANYYHQYQQSMPISSGIPGLQNGLQSALPSGLPSGLPNGLPGGIPGNIQTMQTGVPSSSGVLPPPPQLSSGSSGQSQVRNTQSAMHMHHLQQSHVQQQQHVQQQAQQQQVQAQVAKAGDQQPLETLTSAIVPQAGTPLAKKKDAKEATKGVTTRTRKKPTKKDEDSVKSPKLASPTTVSANGAAATAVNGAPKPVVGATSVDHLMLLIQAQAKHVEKVQRGETAEPFKVADSKTLIPAPGSLNGGVGKRSSNQQLKHKCDFPDCNKSFGQKTHLDIHMRSHSGERPYACDIPGCGKSFSQKGNLRTHRRSHTGEKPYKCDHCGKQFAQRGNYRAHKLIHKNYRPFVCKLDNCSKTFTQLGNLKAHQNKFHSATVQNLTQRFAFYGSSSFMGNVMSVPPEEREMFKYFSELYKNSNRGIKGRGKDSKIQRLPGVDDKSESGTPVQSQAAPTQQSQQAQAQPADPGVMSNSFIPMSTAPAQPQPMMNPLFSQDGNYPVF